MSKFKFRNNTLTLEIEDEVFEITMEDFINTNRFLDIAKRAEDLQDSKNKEDILNLIREIVDEILEEGATDKIFKNRPLNISDGIDLIIFLNQEINKFKAEKLKTIYSVNRQDELIN